VTGVFPVELTTDRISVAGLFVVGGVPQWTFPLRFALPALGYLVGSVVKELPRRGFVLTNFAEGFQVGPVGPTGAVAVGIALTSGVFAADHPAVLSATPIGTVSIALAGGFLAPGYVLTGELALPIGGHVARDVFEGDLRGFPISGSTTTSTVGIDQGDPDLLTGGAFGPEAGLSGVAAILVGTDATAVRARYTRGPVGVRPALPVPDRRR